MFLLCITSYLVGSCVADHAEVFDLHIPCIVDGRNSDESMMQRLIALGTWGSGSMGSSREGKEGRIAEIANQDRLLALGDISWGPNNHGFLVISSEVTVLALTLMRSFTDSNIHLKSKELFSFPGPMGETSVGLNSSYNTWLQKPAKPMFHEQEHAQS